MGGQCGQTAGRGEGKGRGGRNEGKKSEEEVSWLNGTFLLPLTVASSSLKTFFRRNRNLRSKEWIKQYKKKKTIKVKDTSCNRALPCLLRTLWRVPAPHFPVPLLSFSPPIFDPLHTVQAKSFPSPTNPESCHLNRDTHHSAMRSLG